ncbi:MAG: AAA family ATPase [Acidimicrobiia bacterium]
MEALRVHLFGGFLLVRHGVALPPIASRVGRSLFAYLIMHRGRPLQRDLLAGSFWPDLPEVKARRRLSQTLWQIQDVVNEGSISHISATTDTLAFDSAQPYWLDVEQFDQNYELAIITSDESGPGRRVDATALRSCVEMYRGDFMAGFFDDWVVLDQDQYRQRYIVALRRLVDVAKADGAYDDALAHARRLTHHDPLSEDIHQEVMRLCFLLGRTSEAVEQFERYKSILNEELETLPSPEMRGLYERIIRQRSAGISPTPEGHRAPPLSARRELPFVGRDEERRQLVDSMERVLGGPGGVVLVEGEPGVGKTRLIAEAAEDAAWRGFEVSWGGCRPGALRPFAPLAEVLESLSQLRVEQLAEQVEPVWFNEALRLAPRSEGNAEAAQPSPPLRPTEESTRMKEALVRTLAALGRITPHLVVIDDVQWADKDTLAVLNQLGRRLSGSRILVVLLYRSEEARGDPDAWDTLRDLDRVAGLGRVVLSPLSVFELGDVVKKTLGVARIEPKISAQFHRRTGGNVLFALETLHAFRDQGLLDGDNPADSLASQLEGQILPVAPRVRSVIESRISLLGEFASTVCQAAAVSSDAAGLAVLSAASEIPRADVVDAVDELLHRGLLRDTGDGMFVVAHDQVQQVVYESMDSHQRARMHGRFGIALEAAESVDVEAAAYHFSQAGDFGRAAPYLLKAGLRAGEIHAYATASKYLQSARELTAAVEWPVDERYRLLAELEGVLDVLGLRAEQFEVLDEMERLTGSRPDLEGDMEQRRAWLFAHTAEFERAEQSARRAIALARSGGDRSAQAASLVALGTAMRWSGKPLDAVSYLQEAVAEAAANSVEVAEALTELASTLVEVQRFDEAQAYLVEALGIYDACGDLRGEAEVAGIQARAFHQQGERDRAEARFERAIEICQRLGYRHGEGVNLVNMSLLHHVLGRVADALPGYERAGTIFAELGNVRGEAMVLANAASARHDPLGDDARAFEDATTALRYFSEIGDHGREAQCMEILAGIASRRGDLDEAHRLLVESLETLANTGNRYLEGQHLRSLALLELDRGDPSLAAARLDTADRLCADNGLDDLGVELLSIRAMVLLEIGDTTSAYEMARQAVAGLTPGVEHRYLVHHRHALAAEAEGHSEESREASILAVEMLESVLAGLEPAERSRSLQEVPENAEIVAVGDRLIPKTINVRLPAVDAPMGRRLRTAELRPVTWTIDHPDDAKGDSPIARRRRRVMRLLDEARDRGAVPAIDQLASALAVSDSTIRRDLSALRVAGHDVETRGDRHRAS